MQIVTFHRCDSLSVSRIAVRTNAVAKTCEHEGLRIHKYPKPQAAKELIAYLKSPGLMILTHGND